MEEVFIQANANAIALVVASIMCPGQLASAQLKAHLSLVAKTHQSVIYRTKG